MPLTNSLMAVASVAVRGIFLLPPGQVARRLPGWCHHPQRLGPLETVHELNVELDDRGGVAASLGRRHLLDARADARLVAGRSDATDGRVQVSEVTAQGGRQVR